MMKHNIFVENVLELIKPYYHEKQEKTTCDSDGDTSYK